MRICFSSLLLIVGLVAHGCTGPQETGEERGISSSEGQPADSNKQRKTAVSGKVKALSSGLEYDLIATAKVGNKKPRTQYSHMYHRDSNSREDVFSGPDRGEIQTTVIKTEDQTIRLDHTNKTYSITNFRMDKHVSDPTTKLLMSELGKLKQWEQQGVETVNGYECEVWSKGAGTPSILDQQKNDAGGPEEKIWVAKDLGGMILRFEQTNFLGIFTSIERQNVAATSLDSTAFEVPAGYRKG